jgi:hypothetical protein
MPDKSASRETRESRTNNNVLIGLVLAAVIGVLILVGVRVFDSGEKSTNMSETQPTTQAPATGSTQ